MALLDVIVAVNKRAGYQVANTANNTRKITHISTGSFVLDLALLGGVPENLSTMFIGKQHSGKSLMALKTVANFQKKYDGKDGRPKKYVVWVTVGEGDFPTEWASKNGVDVSEEGILIMNPSDGDLAVDIIAAFFEEDDVCCVVVDAVPGLATSKELDKAAEDALQPGSVAVPLQRLLKKVGRSMAKSAASGESKTLIQINQWRDGIGSAPHTPRSVPGGKYARHYNWIEVELYNTQVQGTDANGIKTVEYNEHTFKIHKNKVGNSIMEGEFKLIRGNGGELPVATIDDFSTVATYAQKFNLVTGAGKGWTFHSPLTKKANKFESKKDVVQYLQDHKDEYEALKKEIIGLHRVANGLSKEY